MNEPHPKEERVTQAILAKDLPLLEQLVANEYNIDEIRRNRFDETLLMFAIRQNWIDGVRLLMEKGCDINFLTDFISGYRCLEMARFSIRRNIEIVQLLKDAGAIGDATIPDWDDIAVSSQLSALSHQQSLANEGL